MSRRHQRHRQRDKNRNRPNQGQQRPGGGQNGGRREQQEPEPPPRKPIRYGIVFYDTFAQAKADLDALTTKATEVDQLNIVIKAEGNQWDQDLLKFGKLFAGEAWTLIHTRRVEEGWYNEPH